MEVIRLIQSIPLPTSSDDRTLLFLSLVLVPCRLVRLTMLARYVETLLGRRRYLPQVNSAHEQERARAERQAANTVCQGSAADLLKLAATNIAARYGEIVLMRLLVDCLCALDSRGSSARASDLGSKKDTGRLRGEANNCRGTRAT